MKKLIFLILLISFCNCLFAQDTTKTKEKRKNNAIKGIIAVVPINSLRFLSLGYERCITSNSSLNLTLNGFSFGSGEGTTGQSLSIIPSYIYYFSSKYKFINNIWLNPYLIYTHNNSGGDYKTIRTNNYGLGLSTGKRMYFSHKKRLFFDLGFGMSYIKINYKYYEEWVSSWNPSTMKYEYTAITSHSSTYSWYPRFIFLLGYKF